MSPAVVSLLTGGCSLVSSSPASRYHCLIQPIPYLTLAPLPISNRYNLAGECPKFSLLVMFPNPNLTPAGGTVIQLDMTCTHSGSHTLQRVQSLNQPGPPQDQLSGSPMETAAPQGSPQSYPSGLLQPWVLSLPVGAMSWSEMTYTEFQHSAANAAA